MPKPQAHQDPSQDSVVFSTFSGLKNTVSKERLGPAELAVARNIDLDDAGQAHRRRGYALKLAGNCHSLFRSSRGVFGVKDEHLILLNPDYTYTNIISVGGVDPLSFVELGPDIYFSSPQNSGIIRPNLTVSPWGEVVSPGFWLSPIVDPTPYSQPVAGKLLGSPPMASAIAYFNGRIYMASRRTLWATELYLYGYVDKTRNHFLFESNITAIGTVTDGIYVGTENDCWFLSGRQLSELKRIQVLDYGVVKGTMCPAPGELINPTGPLGQPAIGKAAVLFMTQYGLIAGLDGGENYNLTQTEVLMPTAASGASLFRRQDGVNQYIGVLNSRGTPTTSARIGDYVDAEIIRFQGDPSD
jgi:hypothetical protein